MPQELIEFEGLDELERRLQALPEKVRRLIQREALRAAAEPIRAEISRRAPRAGKPSHPEIVPGHLADHIIIGQPRTTQDGANVNTGAEKGYYWGLFLEYGTSKMRARPFGRPAFDSKAREALDVLADELWEGIKRHA